MDVTKQQLNELASRVGSVIFDSLHEENSYERYLILKRFMFQLQLELWQLAEKVGENGNPSKIQSANDYAHVGCGYLMHHRWLLP